MILKDTAYRNRKLLDLANGQPCANCGADDGTIVAAHANWADYGKGARRKADDCFIAFLCWICHRNVDQGNWSNQAKREVWECAHRATMLSLWKQGLIVLGDGSMQAKPRRQVPQERQTKLGRPDKIVARREM